MLNLIFGYASSRAVAWDCPVGTSSAEPTEPVIRPAVSDTVEDIKKTAPKGRMS